MSLAAKYSGAITGLYRFLWLGKVESRAPEIPPGSVVLAAHYNGAVDGFTYGSQIREFIAVVSVQWQRLPFGRWLWPGIPVKRNKDKGSAAGNTTAFSAIFQAVESGDTLLFFPEGTSRLGRERLPIQPGTLLLLRKFRAMKRVPAVYFAAAQYHNPTTWGSAVSIGWSGPVPLPPSSEQDKSWVRDNLLRAQTKAYAMPAPAPRPWIWLGALCALPFLPLWAAVAAAARRIADDDNVIAIWKFLIGVPATLLGLGVGTFAAFQLGWPWWLPLASLTGGWLLWKR